VTQSLSFKRTIQPKLSPNQRSTATKQKKKPFLTDQSKIATESDWISTKIQAFQSKKVPPKKKDKGSY
jgi:hypothetical protein